MQLEHSFSVPAGIDEAWKILLDIDRVGRCLPGASVDSIDGDDVAGTLKVKLGPINLAYKGQATIVEKDEAARRAVIDARGDDARGKSSAEARVTATLSTAADDTTEVKVNTDLHLTGKPAQFGRGVMVDVGAKLLAQFAEELARTIRGAPPAAPDMPEATTAPAAPEPADPAPASTPAEAATPSYSVPGGIPATSPESVASVNGHPASAAHPAAAHRVEPLELLKDAGPAVARRLAPIAVALLVVLLAIRRRRQR